MTEIFKIAIENYNNNKYEEAIVNFKDVIQNSKSNDEKYISCLRIHDTNVKLQKESFFYLIESYKYDNKRIEGLFKLITHYNVTGYPQISYSFYLLIKDYFENEFIDDYENILKLADKNYPIIGYDFYFKIFNKEKLLSEYIYKDSVRTMNNNKYYNIAENYIGNKKYMMLYSTINYEIVTSISDSTLFFIK